MLYWKTMALSISTESSVGMSESRTPIRVYLAAPLFNDMERSFNVRLAEI